MKRILVSVFAGSMMASQLHGQSILEGVWTGTSQFGDETSAVSVTFRPESGGVKGFLDHPDTGMSARELTGITIDGKTVKFLLPLGSGSIPFEATVTDELM